MVIVGGGFAGLACARNLANDKRFAITLLDRENHHLFQPLLYQVATAALAAPDIARSLRGILHQARNVTVFLDKITEIDADQQEVRSAEGSYPYDYLVLATGARTSFFGNEHWRQYRSDSKPATMRRRFADASSTPLNMRSDATTKIYAADS